MISQQVAPIMVRAVDPATSKDSGGFGIGTDGQTYVIKSPDKHRLLPATEAICEALAVACQLPATTGAWIEVGGVSCYGSRFEGGLSRPIVRGTQLEINARRRDWQRCTNQGMATAAFAFDLFVFNYDRHHNNWAFQDQNGNLTARIFDFSRAWWVLAQDPGKLPGPRQMRSLPRESERTCHTYATVSGWSGHHAQAGFNVLNLLRQIGPNWLDAQMKLLPAGWLDTQTADLALQWWSGALRTARIDEIEQGLKDGTLF